MLFLITTFHMSAYLPAMLFQRTRVLGSREAGHRVYEEVRAMHCGFLGPYIQKKSRSSTYTLQSEFPCVSSLVKKVLLHKFGHEDRETLFLMFNLYHGKSQIQKWNGSVNPHHSVSTIINTLLFLFHQYHNHSSTICSSGLFFSKSNI